ncbi:MAG: DUF3303 family protein [Candidatus Palauibacterales bacterium]|nr:DUF3303 family protein [Candidatus Palauibacterales bacterium]MDP2530667.1 DUF3303 family protein [Candidatus Palauibacterales bacterium]MDP2583378.1 DUF3303 family protein [Candidatus Palauibacterales bacterium]
MKFMVTWRVHEDKRHEVLEAFSQMTPEEDRADLGDAVRLIGRWHDVASFTGVAICESDDASAVAGWVLNWNSIMDCEVTPVLDDEETRALGRAKS